MKNFLLFFVLISSLPSFAQDHPFGDAMERQREKKAKQLAAQAADTAKAMPAPTVTAAPTPTPAATAKATTIATPGPATTPIKPATTARHTPAYTPTTPAVRSAAPVKPATTPAAVTTMVPDATPAVATKPKHDPTPAVKATPAKPAKIVKAEEPASSNGIVTVLIGQIKGAHTSRELIMLAPRLISQDASCDVRSYSFSISNSKGQTWGPMASQGAEFTYQMKDKIKEWDGPCTIKIDSISLISGERKLWGLPITLTYDR